MASTVLGFKTYVPGTIPTDLANILSVGLGLTYVGSLYLSKNARLSFSKSAKDKDTGQPRSKENNERWRDDPDVIRARLAAVSSATVVCCVGIYALVGYVDAQEEGSPLPILHTLNHTRQLLGLTSTTYLAHLPTILLYLGPLVASYFRRELPLQLNWSWKEQKERFFGIVGLRNYWIAPATEELVFRSCVLALYQLARVSKWRMLFVAPLTFGLAHIHHAWDTYNRYGRTKAAAKRAVFSSLFQFVYTTLFGIHTSYLFTRTGSILPAISAHIFCNVMGLPEVGDDIDSAGTVWEAWGMGAGAGVGVGGENGTVNGNRGNGNMDASRGGNVNTTNNTNGNGNGSRGTRGWGKVGRRIVGTAYVAGVLLFVGTLGRWTKVGDSIFWR